jgi:hypothetical protein
MPVLTFKYDVSKTSIETQNIKESLIAFTNPQPDKCPMNYKISAVKTGQILTGYYVDQGVIINAAPNKDTEIFVYKDSSKATKLFSVKSNYQNSRMEIATVKAIDNDFVKTLEFNFKITVEAYMTDESGADVLRKAQDIEISISACDQSCSQCD